MKKSFFIFIISLFFCTSINSQDLGSKLSKVTGDYAKVYLRSLHDALGANFNSGFIKDANIPYSKKLPVGINVSLRLTAMNTFMLDEDRVFSMSYYDTGYVNGHPVLGKYTVKNAPSAIGNTTEPIAEFTYQGINYPDQNKTLIGGVLNTAYVPFLIPELSIGSIYGTDAQIKVFPKITIGDLGGLGLYSFALRHNISHYFNEPSLDVAIQAGYQKFFIDDSYETRILNSNSFFANVQVSKTLKIFTFYGGAQWEHFNTDISYTYNNNTGTVVPVNFSMKAINMIRGVLGASIKYGFFEFGVDANISQKFTAVSHISFIFK